MTNAMKWIVPVALIGGGGVILYMALRKKGTTNPALPQPTVISAQAPAQAPMIVAGGGGRTGPSQTASDIALIGGTLSNLGVDLGGIFS